MSIGNIWFDRLVRCLYNDERFSILPSFGECVEAYGRLFRSPNSALTERASCTCCKPMAEWPVDWLRLMTGELVWYREMITATENEFLALAITAARNCSIKLNSALAAPDRRFIYFIKAITSSRRFVIQFGMNYKIGFVYVDRSRVFIFPPVHCTRICINKLFRFNDLGIARSDRWFGPS